MKKNKLIKITMRSFFGLKKQEAPDKSLLRATENFIEEYDKFTDNPTVVQRNIMLYYFKKLKEASNGEKAKG